MLNACRNNPATTCVASYAFIIALAWRQFLLGHHSPFNSDIRHYHHPVTRAVVDALGQGRLPLWTDSTYFGFPLLADPQTAVWYPGTLLVAGLGPHWGYVAFLVLHSLLAAVGMLGLMRSHGIGWWVAWLTGLLLALSGYYAHEAQHPGLFAILCWFPSFLWAAHAVFERATKVRIAAAALTVAMMVFAGTLQVLFGVIILYGFYAIGRVLDAAPVRGWPDSLRAACSVIAAQLLGACLAAVALVPAVMHLPQTARSLGMTYEFASMGSIPPLEILGLFVNGAAIHSGVGNSYYLGSLSLALAIVGVVSTKQRNLARGLALGVAVLLLIAMGQHSGLHAMLYDWFPGIVGGLRGVGRALGPAAVALAMLAGLGLQALFEADRPAEFSSGQGLFAGLLLAGLLGYGVLFWVVPESLSSKSAGSAIVVLAALVLSIVPFFSNRFSESRFFDRFRPTGGRDGAFASLVGPWIVALVALDVFAFGPLDDVLSANPPPPATQGIPDVTPELDEIAAGKFGRKGERLMLHGFGPLNLPLLQQLDAVGGYNPLVMLRYLDFVNLINKARLFPRKPIDQFVSGSKPQRFEPALFDAASIRYVISTKPDAVRGLALVERFSGTLLGTIGASLYENEAALPRAYLAYHTLYAASEEDLERLLGQGFDGRRATVVEGVGPLLDGPESITAIERTVARPEVQNFEISPKHPAILVVTDSWYPGWRARVDGIESPVFRVNALFRGVAVPAGAERVEMRFDPWTFRVGGGISLAALSGIGILLAMAWIERGRGRRRRKIS